MMARNIRNGWLITVIAAFIAMSARVLADDPLVYATIQPAQITLGESARYTITNLGNGTDAISMPVVSGLQFEVIARSRQFEIFNGTMLPSTVIVMRVTPQIAGIFTIPAATPKSQPLVLQVSAPPSVNLSVPGIGVAPYRAPILSGGSMPKGIHLTEDGSAFVRLNIPKREVYVGESVPVEIQLGMRSGFVTSVNGLPKLTGDEFTLNNLSHSPERGEEVLDGQPFVLLTWRSVLAVVKPGTFSLSAEAPITVKIRTRPRRESMLDDQFGDPFFQNLFGVTVPKDINAASPSSELKVLALPHEGRPPDFHGAIGTFTIESDISPAAAMAGDPLTLRMRVAGSGNFDRVDTTMLDHVDQWKTYPPKSSFNSTDPTGHRGEKTFEQPLIALKPGVQTLPALSFSYFDPNTRRYETARSAPLNVRISPSLADSTLAAPQSPGSSGSAATDTTNNGLRPDHAPATSFADTLAPAYLQPRFLEFSSLLALAFAGGWLAARQRKDERPSSRNRRAAKTAKRVLADMEAAARARKVALFFNVARLALQEVLAAEWRIAPDQVTSTEVRDRADVKDEDIRLLFALADESNYSGQKLGATDYARWMRMVRQRLLGEKAA
jgi:hypothetical protein